MAGNGLEASKVIVRIGMSNDVPILSIGEPSYDVDTHTARMGDGSADPPRMMTTKSVGIFKFDSITYVEYPQINMVPDGTVDGVDISDLNQTNGYIVRRGDNLWAARSINNSDGYLTISNGDGVGGNTGVNLSASFISELNSFLTYVAVDDITIHGNGHPEAPLYAQASDNQHAGVVRRATAEETIDGVNDNSYISPADLSQRTATQDRTGIIRLSRQDEVDAGVDLTTAVSPGTLKHYVDTHSSGGYYQTNYIENSGSQGGGEEGQNFFTGRYNLSDFTYPTFLRFENEQPGYVTTTSGIEGGGGSNNGTGSEVTHFWGAVTVTYTLKQSGTILEGDLIDSQFNEMTVMNGTLYGVRGYEFHPIASVAGLATIFFQIYTAGRMNRIRYQRVPITPQ